MTLQPTATMKIGLFTIYGSYFRSWYFQCNAADFHQVYHGPGGWGTSGYLPAVLALLSPWPWPSSLSPWRCKNEGQTSRWNLITGM